MTKQFVTPMYGATQVQTPRDNFACYIASRIAYQRTRANTTTFQASRDHALAEVARYQRLLMEVVQ